MNILLTGGTGLIGRALCRRWLADGHRLWVWSRTPQRVAALCGAEVQGVGSLQQLDAVALDAVVNLAGAPIADRPWTKSRKALLWDSRVKLTEQLVEWLGRREQKPALLISGSAVGWYGDGGEHRLTEGDQPVSTDFATGERGPAATTSLVLCIPSVPPPVPFPPSGPHLIGGVNPREALEGIFPAGCEGKQTWWQLASR